MLRIGDFSKDKCQLLFHTLFVGEEEKSRVHRMSVIKLLCASVLYWCAKIMLRTFLKVIFHGGKECEFINAVHLSMQSQCFCLRLYVCTYIFTSTGDQFT